MSTAQESYASFTKSSEFLDPSKLDEIVAQLKPATVAQLTAGNGEWRGGVLKTGHPTEGLLEKLDWAGKTFRGIDDVEPIVLFNERRERIFGSEYGPARLRHVQDPQGRVTVAMLYDQRPIIDFFYYVNDKIMAGVMDNKDVKDHPTHHFYLYKE